MRTAIQIFLIALTTLVSNPARTAWGLTIQDQAEIQRVEVYFSGISTMRARFTQIDSNNNVSYGTFYLSRPGRMRVEYDQPVPYLYVADGTWLTFWDNQLHERSDVLLGSSIADLFIRQNVQLSGDVKVTSVRHYNANNSLEIDVVQKDDPDAGELTLVFTKSPLALMRWRVRDAQGASTEVILSQSSFGMNLEQRLFEIPMLENYANN